MTTTVSLIAPNATPGMTLEGASGTVYVSSASGMIAGVMSRDIEAFLDAGCTYLSAAEFDAAGTASALPRPQIEQIVGANGFAANGTYGNIAAYDRFECQNQIRVGNAPVSGLRIGYAGWQNLGGAAGEASIGNALITRSSMISTDSVTGQTSYAAGTFENGADSAVLANGADLLLTQPFKYSFQACADVNMKTCWDAPDFAGSWPTRDLFRYSTDSTAISSSIVQDTQIYSTAANLSTPAGGGTYPLMGPYCLIGKFKTPQVAVVAQADSFGEGIGDTSSDGYNLGYISRAFWNGGVPIPHVNNSRGSQNLHDMEAGGNRQRGIWKYATDLYTALGRNDIGGSLSVTQLQNDCLKWWSDIKATNGCTGKPLRITQSLIAPSSLSNWRVKASGFYIANGGSGYAASSTFNVTLSSGNIANQGGTGANAVFSVTTNASGVVTTINSIVNQGLYQYGYPPGGSSPYPNGNATTAATQGGSGLTIYIVSEGWFDYTNQFVQNGWASGGQRDQMNAFYQASLASGLVDNVVDFNTNGWEGFTSLSSPQHGLWLSDGATGFYETIDGIHPCQRGHISAGATLNALFLTYGVP